MRREKRSSGEGTPPPPVVWKYHLIWGMLCVLMGVVVNRLDRYYYSSPANAEGEDRTPGRGGEGYLEKGSWGHEMRSSEEGKESYEYRGKAFFPEETHPLEDIRGFDGDYENWPPGHMGLGLEIYRMDFKTKSARKRMLEQHAFEEFVSNIIPLNRELPDWRDPWCKEKYEKEKDLPSTSIIICFHNEARSTLLRSIHSIVNRSPKELIREIILVDDASTLDHLGKPLEDYIQQNFPGLVKLIRLKERHGLMRSRMVGIKAASARVLTFLDSHIEATAGWLEPLLQVILEDPMAVPCPVIDAINDTTLYYTFIRKDLYGLFNWRMEFEWHELSQEETRAKENVWAPHDNPVMAGGLFSIDRSWFEHLGYYDEGMNIWGGENLELSFKIWMCGGSIKVIPCSRVGHIYRSWSPYKVDVGDIKRNNIRVAKVWMDEFQHLFFDRFGEYENRGDTRLGNYGDVEARRDLRKNLSCQNFRWYLDNVASNLPYHELIGAGEIRHSDLCLDKNDRIDNMDEVIHLSPCHGTGGFQYWWMGANRYLMRDYLCIGTLDDNTTVVVTHCARVTPWQYNPNLRILKYEKTGTCLSVNPSDNRLSLTMKDCDDNDEMQKWTFSFFNPSGLDYGDLK